METREILEVSRRQRLPYWPKPAYKSPEMPKKLHEIIRERFQLGPANHMTHIENLGPILQAGGVRSFNQMKGTGYKDLSNPDVQQGRAQITVPGSRPLHDYVPLYFGFKTPMVAVNQDRNPELIFLRVSLDILGRPGVIITDGNARTKGTTFQEFRSVEGMKILDVKAIQSVKYALDPEMKRRKQAEILVPDLLSFSEVLDLICFDPKAAKRVLDTVGQFGIGKSVIVNQGWYFKKLEGG